MALAAAATGLEPVYETSEVHLCNGSRLVNRGLLGRVGSVPLCRVKRRAAPSGAAFFISGVILRDVRTSFADLGLGGLSGAEVGALWECLYLKPDEVRELVAFVRENATHPWLYPMVCTAAHTGARRSELIRMEAGDIDGSGEVTIRERKRVHGSKTTRRVTLTPFLKDVLRDWLRLRPAGKFLFTQTGVVARSKKRSRTTGHKGDATREKTAKGRKETVKLREVQGSSPLTHDEVADHFDRVLSGSKWDVLRGWHTLRHSACSAMAAAGVDQRVIDEVMGHSTEQQRRRYRHHTPTTKAEAMRRAFG